MPGIRQRLSTRRAIKKQNRKAGLEKRKAKLMDRIPETRARVARAMKGVERASRKATSAKSAHYKNVRELEKPAPMPKRVVKRVRSAISTAKYRKALEKENTAAARAGKERQRAYRLGRKLVRVDKKLKK